MGSLRKDTRGSPQLCSGSNCLYNKPYRKFSVNCRCFKTSKEMERKNCYIFLKNMLYIKYLLYPDASKICDVLRRMVPNRGKHHILVS